MSAKTMTSRSDMSPAVTTWFHLTRTKRGKEVVTGKFCYARSCEVGNESLVLVTDGALMWMKITKAGARELFELGDAVDDDIAQEIEKNHGFQMARE